MPMPLAVVRFNAGCGGVVDLLLLVSPADEFTEEQRELTTRLVISYYMNYLDRTQPQPSKKWEVKLIKREINTSGAEEEKQAYYYYVVTSQKAAAID
jgi:hypothetical protein